MVCQGHLDPVLGFSSRCVIILSRVHRDWTPGCACPGPLEQFLPYPQLSPGLLPPSLARRGRGTPISILKKKTKIQIPHLRRKRVWGGVFRVHLWGGGF